MFEINHVRCIVETATEENFSKKLLSVHTVSYNGNVFSFISALFQHGRLVRQVYDFQIQSLLVLY